MLIQCGSFTSIRYFWFLHLVEKKDNYTFQKQNMKSKVMLQIIKQQRSQDFKLGFKVKLGLLIKLLGYRFLKRHL